MNTLITVSANIGSAKSTGIMGWINKRRKNKAIKKINDQIDVVVNNLNMEELADFIKCEISIRGNVICHDGVLISFEDDSVPLYYYINFVSCNIVFFHWYDYSGERDIDITYRDGELILGTSGSRLRKYNENTMKEFDFDPMVVLSQIVRNEMKILCDSLVFQKGGNQCIQIHKIDI
jgi:hypothetical protein